jgi:hypothetical protein
VAGLIEDPEAEKRSLMMRRKALCNGASTGRCCVHYWVHVEKVESNNADYLRRGELYRVCGYHPSIANEMSHEQLATECNQFVPRRLPMWKRPLALLRIVSDPGKYDPSFEDYQPLTPEQIQALQDEMPSSSAAIAEMAKVAQQARNPEVSLSEALDDDEPGSGIFSKED